MTWRDDIDGIAVEVDRIVASAQQTGWQAPAVESELGSIRDYMAQVRGLLPVDPPITPPDPPPAAILQGFGGSYSGHDPARDIYLGTDPEMAAWGVHWGHPVLAPAAGTVTVYTFPTPLSAHRGLGMPSASVDAAASAQYDQNHADLFRGISTGSGCYAYGLGQTMYFALLTFDTPQRLSNGQQVRAIWAGHVRGDIPAGRVAAGDRWATSWDSGVRFESAGLQVRASHVHTCGTVSGALTMNGEVDGFLVAELLGWQVQNVGTVPGPDAYLTGQYIAGKPKSAWAGHPIPPMPQ